MTTTVTVAASGPNYPARVLQFRRQEDAKGALSQLIASGETATFNVGEKDTLIVTEEYHADGYPPPAK